jgi:VWFA-related protein
VTLVITALGGLCGVTAGPARAQGAGGAVASSSGAQQGSTNNFRSVMIYFSARDGDGKMVTDLKVDDMTLRVDGRPQKIGTFLGVASAPPLTLELLIDVSGSRAHALAGMEKKYAQDFFMSLLDPGDLAYVREFAADDRLLASASGDPKVLAKAVNDESQPRGVTALFDAVLDACQNDLAGSDTRSKVILLIADGGNNHGEAGQDAVEKCLRKENVVIDAVGVIDPFDLRGRNLEGMQGPALLETLTRRFGGGVWFATDEGGFQRALGEVALEIRDRYAIAFAGPAPNANGRPHKIELTTSRKHTILFAPQDMPDGEPIGP